MRRRNIVLFFGVAGFLIAQKTKALPLLETDSIAIPFSALYQDSWGGTNTRLRTNIFDKSQNYTLPLQINDSDVFVFPVARKTYVCSPYGIRSGRQHTGMDIKQNLGDSIVAAWNGIVRMANKSYYGYGGTVVIRHLNGLETIYAHLSGIEVKVNQAVKAGELVGYAGRTGRATTEHLHFETRFLYEHFDPRTIIDFDNFSLKTDTLYIRKGKFSNNPLFNPVFENITEESLDSEVVEDNLDSEENPPEEKPKTIEIRPPQSAFYIVKKGDTLYSIARENKITIDYLCKINNITQNGILQIGQKLKLKQ